jgi:hypothetical protein
VPDTTPRGSAEDSYPNLSESSRPSSRHPRPGASPRRHGIVGGLLGGGL